MTENLLEVRGLCVKYKSSEADVHAVNGITFSLGRGETMGIVGETGAGKTTSALAILQLLPERTGEITSGEIIYKGEDLLRKTKAEMRAVRGAMISMIFQDPMTSLNPVMTVGDQILESLRIHNSEDRGKKELDERVDELLTLVNIQPKRKREYPHQFSGGMKQRVGIAMALACEPELLIADEPTTALDVTIQAQVLALMDELKTKFGTSMIMITHDLGIVAETCDKVAIIYAGEIVEQGSARDIFEGERHHPYTTGLFGSIPNLGTSSRRLSPIDGLMPDPANLPRGCKFHERCGLGDERCETVRPEPSVIGGHSISCHHRGGGEAKNNAA
ncbi:MAG: ABC transporter ATP-binding protein [Synergistaceae bacterium]|jgi:peptide/nickel transport system ATP-binding protein|nr:ABC transporter ATP-binding protein [Synergistaceae bacterium]